MSDELKAGTRVRITLEGRLEYDTYVIGGKHDTVSVIDGDEHTTYLENVPVGKVEVIVSSLDDYGPGIYVTANNREHASGACLIKHRGHGDWVVYGLVEKGKSIEVSGSEAEAHIERWIRAFGPLVPLQPEEEK